ncbi:hypothetical protein FD754_002166, partial [Muntiacus muntjak]
GFNFSVSGGKEVWVRIKSLPAMRQTWIPSLGWDDPWRRARQPLQCSCLENPMERGAWRATVRRIILHHEYMHHIFFRDSSTDGHSGCSHSLAIINSAAVNLGVQILLSDIDFASVRYILRSSIAGSFGSANFNILRTLLLFSTSNISYIVLMLSCKLMIWESLPKGGWIWRRRRKHKRSELVHSGPGKGSPQAGVDLSFATRTGTQQGIETHLFRAEVSRDLSHWTRSIVQGSHNSAELTAEVSTACTYKNQACRLTIHYENGFSITTEPQEGAFPKTIIQAPYEKLKMSSDDGIRMLYLDFGGKDGELQLDLHSCPKPIVFILHSFLSAKITRLGLVA